MMEVRINYPFTSEALRPLKAGTVVLLSGRVVTGRDRFHRLLATGGTSPVDLREGAIYHCGPVVIRRDAAWVVQAAGPTTSARLDPFMPAVLEASGATVIIGKGGMGAATRAACVRNGCVYVHAVGGAASLLASHVTRVLSVHYLKEFGAAEAVWELEVRDFPGVVTIDASGRSLHQRVLSASRRALADAMR